MDSNTVSNTTSTPLKIVITGPESTGKSTLAEALANYYQAEWVPEYARVYIDKLNRPYHQYDLLEIAKGQMALEQRLVSKHPELLFCDTDLITIYIWSKFKYNWVHEQIVELIRSTNYDMYLLCKTDVPWEFDPQRENPNQRDELYALYKSTLREFNKPFIEISGIPSIRLSKAIEVVDFIIKPSNS